jgi:cytochrome c oxidase subunit 2
VIVTIFGFWAGLVLRDNERVAQAGTPTRTVLVTGSQYQWSFKYLTDGGFESTKLYLPIDQGVKLETTATDVIHGFYVAEWRVKKDAVPGQINYTFATPDKIGTFRVLCSQLCGGGHAAMQRANDTEVVSAADFEKWVAQQKKSASTTPAGQKIFLGSAGCGGCHALSKAGSKGSIGPNLDNIAADAKAAGENVQSFVRESIVNPNAHIAKGYPANVMPKTYGSSLSKKDLDALVTYISGGSK